MPAKERLLKGEARFSVPGAVSVKLDKYPGKRGKISSYPDAWSVTLEVRRANDFKTITLRPWSDDLEKTLEYYRELENFLRGRP